MDVILRLFFWFFFFKQKTAYEMRISDWSSDVCSSDLVYVLCTSYRTDPRVTYAVYEGLLRNIADYGAPTTVFAEISEIGRASCRERVVSTCRSRWSPYH